MYEAFSTHQRRVLVLAKQYEATRQKRQWGYKCWKELDDKTQDTSVFKQFDTVLKWLEAKGWTVRWIDKHWSGYVQFVFTIFDKSTPQPGQLKNEMLLKQYVLSVPKVEAVERYSLPYLNALRPELSSIPGFLESIGLDDGSYDRQASSTSAAGV